ncbi:MAG: DUF1990 domain-containing protein [Alphaproteobacteria bacterium]|nr:DUF1990 domain-containing protein [Alphaproteobacteria bacterium]
MAFGRGAFTYPDVGATRGTPPKGWSIDRASVVLGHGSSTWNAAIHALDTWRMFDLDWVELREAPHPEPGATVVYGARVFGVWAVNACRIVYVEDERQGSVWHHGFAYGTVGPHTLSGEERFRVSWNQDTDEVVFEIFQFSRPHHLLTKALGPLTRLIQHRFITQALRALQAAVTS